MKFKNKTRLYLLLGSYKGYTHTELKKPNSGMIKLTDY